MRTIKYMPMETEDCNRVVVLKKKSQNLDC